MSSMVQPAQGRLLHLPLGMVREKVECQEKNGSGRGGVFCRAVSDHELALRCR